MIFRSSFLPNFQWFFGGHILNSSHALEVLHEVMQSKAMAPVSKRFAEKCSHNFYVTKTERWSALNMNECPLENGPLKKKSRRTSNMLVFSSIELLRLTSFLVSKWPWFWSACQTPHKFWVVCFDITSTLYESARWQKDTTLVVP